MKYKIRTFANNNFTTNQTNVNNFLLTLTTNYILSISNYAVGTAATTRFITTITYLA
ncbi:hypothetical protein CCP1ISM_250017 [Azospirillaceae bacterium]